MKYYIFIFLILLLGIRFCTNRPNYKNGDRVRITDRVTSDPVNYTSGQYLKLSGLSFYLPLFPEVFYGDLIVVEGVVKDKKLENPKLIKLTPNENNIYNFRKRLVSFYQSVLPEPAAGLVSGITIGNKGALTQKFWEQVKLTGVAHVVVASGTNVTFVVSFLTNFLTLFLPRRKMIPFAILGVVLYLYISGFEAPLTRAALMSSALFLAQEKGRLVQGWQLLFLSAYIMLLINPYWILDIGFIMSFVATTSLMIFEKPISSKIKFIPSLFREGLATSLAAQIGIAPILYVTFGQLNIWSPLINALVLWTVPFIMISGAISAAIFTIAPQLARLVLWICYPIILWFVKVVELFGSQ